MTGAAARRTAANAVFGLPDAMSRGEATRLHDALVELWRACHHRAPGGVRADLELHQRYFDPVAQGKRLRQTLMGIDATRPQVLPRGHAMRVDDERTLITPEGRVAIELLARALEDGKDPVRADEAVAARWQRDLLGLYRDWGRHRLNSTIELLGGGTKPLQLPAIGGSLTLLVNRSDAPRRAIRRLEPGTPRDIIDAAFRACANAFTEQVAPSEKRSTTKERLISGWTLHEVTRRMPDALHISDAGGVYVEPGRRGDLIGLLAAELKRRERIDQALLEDACDALVRQFGRVAQDLAGLGLLFERPADTRRLRGELIEAWRAARA